MNKDRGILGVGGVLSYFKGYLSKGLKNMCVNSNNIDYTMWQGLKKLEENNYRKIILERYFKLITNHFNDRDACSYD